ncbi:MAG: hypothetical protein JKY51_10815 [Opitutaceae bacterium]|nr:hypothetical protein [Opitutaceae bacterium]
MPVPAFVLKNIEKRLEQEGFRAQMDDIHFDPSGTIFVKNIRLYSPISDNPILTCKAMYIDLNLPRLLFRKVYANRVEASGVELFSPPQHSPSGIREKVFSNTHISLTHDNNLWMIHNAIIQLGEFKIKIHGAFRDYTPKIEREKKSLSYHLAQLIKFSPELLEAQEHLSYFNDPILTIKITPRGTRSLIADFEYTSTDYQNPATPKLSAIHLQGTGSFQFPLKGTLQISGSIGRAQQEALWTSKNIQITGQWGSLPNKEAPLPQTLQWRVAEISAHNATLSSLSGKIYSSQKSKILSQFSFCFGDKPVHASATVDIEKGSGILSVSGKGGRNWLELASQASDRNLVKYATLTTEPDFTASVDIQPGWNWNQAKFTLTSGPFLAKGVPIDRSYVTGTVTPTQFEMDTLEVVNGGSFISGSYTTLLSTKDYRFNLRGNFHPSTLSPWFRSWWTNLWKELSFSPKGANCDLSIHGRLRDHSRTLITGITDSSDFSIKGVPFDRFRSKLLIKARYVDLYDLTVYRSEGTVTGDVQLQFEKGQKVPVTQIFNIDSTADIKRIATILGKKGIKMLTPYEYSVPPSIKAQGTIYRKDTHYDSSLDLLIDTPHAFIFNNIPLTHLTTAAFIRNKEVNLPEIHAGIAEGNLTGWAYLQNKDLNFEFALKEARFGKSIALLSEYLSAKDLSPSKTKKKTLLPEGDLGGMLDLSLIAKGILGDPLSYTGDGTIDITEAELGKVHVFGLLSEILQSLMLKFSTLQFTEAHSDFHLDKKTISFPNLHMKGPLAAIKSQGTFTMGSKTLDFRAKVFPFRESRTPIYALIGVITNPFSYMFQVKLDGTYSDPKWRVLVGSGASKKTKGNRSEKIDSDAEELPSS